MILRNLAFAFVDSVTSLTKNYDHEDLTPNWHHCRITKDWNTYVRRYLSFEKNKDLCSKLNQSLDVGEKDEQLHFIAWHDYITCRMVI